MELPLARDGSFRAVDGSDRNLAWFKKLIDRFIRDEFFPGIGVLPESVEFATFIDPESGIGRPMVEMRVATDRIARETFQREFAAGFRAFLAKHAENKQDFLALRREQRKFVVIFLPG